MEIRRNSPVLEKHLSKETALLLHSVQQSWLALDSTTSIGRNTTSIALEPNVQSHADTNCDSDGCSLLVCHLFAHAACDRQTIHVFAAPVTSTYPLCEALCRRTHVRRGSSRARRRIILFAAQVRGQWAEDPHLKFLAAVHQLFACRQLSSRWASLQHNSSPEVLARRSAHCTCRRLVVVDGFHEDPAVEPAGFEVQCCDICGLL